jgi:Chaperonin 10 Kd subunit
VKEGDRVLFGKYSGAEIKVEAQDHLILREDEIIGILTKQPARDSKRSQMAKRTSPAPMRPNLRAGSPPVSVQGNLVTRNEVSMLTQIMMWISITVVLLTVLGLPITSEKAVLQTVLCASGLLVIRQAIRSGQPLLATGFLPIIVAFSPISPIPISSRVFLWLNWIGLAAFVVAVITLKTERKLSMPSIRNRNA